jgi:hypothetical protein
VPRCHRVAVCLGSHARLPDSIQHIFPMFGCETGDCFARSGTYPPVIMLRLRETASRYELSREM